MSYEIPKNLSRYTEEFLFGLSFKQFAYVGGTALVSYLLFIWLRGYMDIYIAAFAVLPFIVLGSAFAFFGLEEKIRAHNNLKNSLNSVSYFDKSVSGFVDVAEIRDNVVVLKNGTLLGIIEVAPIDFFILSKDDKGLVLNAYHEWLRGVGYHVQILSRSVEVNLNNWLRNLKRKSASAEQMSHFSEWIEKEIEDNEVRNRQFYIIIPEKPELKSGSFFEEFKSLFTGNFTVSVDAENVSAAERVLSSNVNNCIETLSRCKVRCRRLQTDELLGLYSSFFTNQSRINKTVLSPIINFGGEDHELA
jgi:hypothetical protein